MLLILNLRHDVPSYYFFFIRIKLYAKKKSSENLIWRICNIIIIFVYNI